MSSPDERDGSTTHKPNQLPTYEALKHDITAIAMAAGVAIEAAIASRIKSRNSLFMTGLCAHRSSAREAITRRLVHKLGAVLTITPKAKDFHLSRPYNLGVVG